MILSMTFLGSYVAKCVWASGALPTSVSETFYKLCHKRHFLTATWGGALTLLAPMLSASGDGTEFLAFLAVAGLLFVGAAPNFKSRQEGYVHTAGAVTLLACSVAWLALNRPACLLFLAAPIASLSLDRSRWLFWTEVAVMTAVYTAVLAA